MASRYLTTAQLIVENIKITNSWIDALSVSIFYQQPITYPADGLYLACWFQSERMLPGGKSEFNSTGYRDFEESYMLHYWEPAPVEVRNLMLDQDAQDSLRDRFASVRDSFLTIANQSGPTGEWRIWIKEGAEYGIVSPTQVAEGSAFVRGFTIPVTVRRARALS